MGYSEPFFVSSVRLALLMSLTLDIALYTIPVSLFFELIKVPELDNVTSYVTDVPKIKFNFKY